MKPAGPVLHTPSGAVFDSVIAAVEPADLVALTPQVADADRAAFEAFIQSELFYHEANGPFMERNSGDGYYVDVCIQAAWLAWNARPPSRPEPTTWQQRLAAELADLNARRLKLRQFLRTDACLALPFDDRALLAQQESIMEELSNVLSLRAKRAGVSS